MTLNLNRMSSYWNRDERIKINDNWDKIEKSYNGVVDEVTQKAYNEIIDTVRDLTKINWLEPVPTYDDIAATYPNPTLGDITITSDDGSVYRYDGEQWVFINKIDPDVYMQLQDDVAAIQNGLEETNNNLMQLQQDFMSHLEDIEEKIIGFVEARQFGAIGDGITDDSDAIQAMLDSSYTDVSLRNGVYRITKGLISSLEGRTIRTEGATILADSEDITVLTVTGKNNFISVDINGNNKAAIGVLVTNGGCDISNCRIKNLYGNTKGSCGIRAETSEGVNIYNNKIKNIDATSNSTIGDNIGSARAILITASIDATEISFIKDNFIDNVLGEEGDAIQVLFYDNQDNSKFLKGLTIIENNTIKNCNRRAIKIQASDVDVLKNKHINTLTVDQLNAAFLIDTINSDNVRIIGNNLDAKLFKAIQITGNSASLAENIIVNENVIFGDESFTLVAIYADYIKNSDISRNSIKNGNPSIGISNSVSVTIESNKFYGDNADKPAINITSNCEVITCRGNEAFGERLYVVQNSAPNCIIENNHNRSGAGGCIRTFATSGGSLYRENTNNSSQTTVIGDLTNQYHSGALNVGNYVSGIPDVIFTSDIPSNIMPNIYFTKGTIAFNTNVTSGGNVGWVCVANGLGGTWKPFGTVET